MQKPISLPHQPGVYRFLDENHHILYVGKARNLQKRVESYFRHNLDKKTTALMQKAAHIEITITETENQALLLESNLIKEHHPKYNILLRDDKSYPYLFLSNDAFPRLDFYRGNKKEKGHYFGPYPNTGSVRDNLGLIQKLFQLRSCQNSFFQHRSRPCLQYQIQRCTAPCVNYVSPENYQIQVKDAVDFLNGQNEKVMQSIQQRMENASDNKSYEEAAHWRDILIRLRQLQQQQFVTGGSGNIDIFGACEKHDKVAIAVVSIRHGQLLGHKTFCLNLNESDVAEALSAFIPQYYLHPARQSDCVDQIVLSHLIEDREWLQNALREVFKNKLQIKDRKTAENRQWLSIAISNAENELKQTFSAQHDFLVKLKALQQALHLPNLPERIECFDISHTQGQLTKASCVVCDQKGMAKKLYRQWNIDNITPGDDYAAMHQVLMRRYSQLKKSNHALPDILIIDGGRGQLHQAASVMESLQISGVTLLGIAKGPTRKAGVEKLFLFGQDAEIELSTDSPARLLLQQIRDEAHRFAITAHRKARGKNQLRSILDSIAGVGKKRKMDLLTHFGGLAELKKASVEDIARVKGVSRALAKRIYDLLNEQP